jgi:hypothetical protein
MIATLEPVFGSGGHLCLARVGTKAEDMGAAQLTVRRRSCDNCRHLDGTLFAATSALRVLLPDQDLTNG